MLSYLVGSVEGLEPERLGTSDHSLGQRVVEIEEEHIKPI
jgi:hypothetical protein